MIPIEVLWMGLIALFGVIGLVRGLWRELGVTTILLLSLFALKMGQDLILDALATRLPADTLSGLPNETIQAIYYISTVAFVTFIAYQGITLVFPIKQQTGLVKWLFGYLGGLVNGYLIVGTAWDVSSQADYFGLKVPLGTTGQAIQISDYLTKLHAAVTRFLPVTLLNANDFIPYFFLALGMILLLAIILK